MVETKLINTNIDENTGIAWLTLNRPEKKNALSIALLAEVAAILRSLAENENIRCIVTTGAGDSYSSGRDLYDMRGQDNRRRTRGFGGVAEIVDIMRKLPQITVAKVRGWCLGGGLALITATIWSFRRTLPISACPRSFAAAMARLLRRRCFMPAFRSRRLSTFRSPEEI